MLRSIQRCFGYFKKLRSTDIVM